MELQRTQRLIFPFILSFSLVACGGSGFSGGDAVTGTATSSNPNGTGTTQVVSKAATLEITASSAQLQSDGSIPVTVSAIVKDQGNIILSDVDIQVTVDGNASVTPATGSGVQTAQITPGLNHPENRTLTVTVNTLDGSNLSESLEIEVTGTEVQIDGPENISLNIPTEFIIKLTDSAGKGLGNEAVEVESTNTQINPVGKDSFVTDINGELKVSVEAVQGGTDTITIKALGASTSKSIALSGEAFVLNSANSEIAVTEHETVTLTLTGISGAPIANSEVSLVATRGVLTTTSVITDDNGHAAFGISSPTAGNTVITATTDEGGLTATLLREFVATIPDSMDTKADPILIAPLSSSTISSTVRDANNNPVKNQKVIFNLNDTINGNLSSSSAVTNSSGRATVIYTAGDTTSAFQGVEINSFVEGHVSTINDDITLTVGGNALRLVLGTDNKVGTNGNTRYSVNYGVIVTDSSGNPVQDQAVEFTVVPVAYFKGELDNSGVTWRENPYIECPIEDTNRNGIIDENEDVNGNGELEPSNTATIGGLSVTGDAKTDSNGAVEIQVLYPRSEAKWSKVELEAKVSVNGTESFQRTQFILPIPAGEYSDTSVQPANAHDKVDFITGQNILGSRYGLEASSSASCANTR